MTEYQVHPFALAYPINSADEEMIRASILKVGVLDPVTLWRCGDGGGAMILDGRTRQKIVLALHNEGVVTAENGEDINLRFEFFSGSEVDAVVFVRAKNLQRRHLSAGQVAAMAVISERQIDEIMESQGAKVRVPGDSIGRTAELAGASRTYVAQCRYILDHDPDQINSVVNGEETPTAVSNRIRLRMKGHSAPSSPPPVESQTESNGNPSSPAPAESKSASSGANAPKESGEKKPKKVKDGNGKEVPEDLEEVFQAREVFSEIDEWLKNLWKRIESLGDGPGGAYLPVRQFKAEFNQMRGWIRDSSPHSPCPYCGGVRVVNGNACGQCNGCGYMDSLTYKLVPEDVRKSHG